MERPFYSVTFGDKNSWDEWNLMPVKAGKIEFATPELKYESVEIPGADNVLDVSEVLTGYPLFDPRKGSLTFRFFDNGKSVRGRFDKLKNYLHGRWMRAVIVDQPEYYYEGRFMVGDFKPLQGNWGEVDISYILNAYKMEITASDEQWLWDPFNFETGVIRDYREIVVGGEGEDPVEMHIEGSPKHQPLSMTFSRNTLPVAIDEGIGFFWLGTYEEATSDDYEVKYGKFTYPQIVIPPEGLDITFSGNYKVTIHYRGGII